MSKAGDSVSIERVREVLDRALGHPSGEREAFIDGACGSDRPLREEVLSLLRALAGAGDLLEPALGEEAPAPQPLTGLEFGAYRVGSRIGAGGMGVVYEAHDTRLERKVAVKALPPRLACDPHRLARFEQEARVVASLNHTNIASIHGFEQTRLGTVMVLEYVPGATLAELLRKRALPVDEAIGIACQIARGLEAAHAAGIVHRDLKPANIKVTPEGGVKILDFGIAKVVAGAGSGAADGHTAVGAMIGTAAYMSPEQARGKPVDRRTDLWAFGCVLFEMLTGDRAFDGDTASDVVAAVLRAEPDWSRLPIDVPAGVRRTLLRCLNKDPDQRLRDAGDARLDLESRGEPGTANRGGGRWRWRVGAGVVVAFGIAAVWILGRPAEHAIPEHRFSIQTPAPISASVGGSVAVSQDGRLLAFAAGDVWTKPRLYLRPLDSFDSAAIAGTEAGGMPFFSPDGRWIGFWGNIGDGTGKALLKRVPVEGGPVQTLLPRPNIAQGASWGDDNTIVFSTAPGTLWRIPAGGGEPVAMGGEQDEGRELHTQPEVLPRSQDLLFTCWRQKGSEWRSGIEAMHMTGGKRRMVIADASQPRYSRESGVLVYLQGPSLMQCPFDAVGVALSGTPRRLLDPEGDFGNGTYARFAVSANGTLVFVPGDVPAPSTELAWLGLDGSCTTVYRSELPVWTLRLSPDGTKAAYTTYRPQLDLWVLDLSRGTTVRLTTTGGAYFPVWTPDGKRIAFEHDIDGQVGIEWMPADGSAPPELLYRHPNGAKCFPTGFSPDGQSLLASIETEPRDSTDIFLIGMSGDHLGSRVFTTPADRIAARFSPDGSMIAYASTETGRSEVYVHPFPAMNRKILVSTEGGERPTWSGDGKQLFYRYAQRLFGVRVVDSPVFDVSKPTVLLDLMPGDRYDPAPDGTRFLTGRPKGEWRPQTTINVVTGVVDRGTP